MTIKTLYKLTTNKEWAAARAEGVFRGSELDQQDGFIHFSTAAQVAETARKYFANVPDIVLLAVDRDMLEHLRAPQTEGATLKAHAGAEPGDSPLRWEASQARTSELFPHLYALLPSGSVQSVTPIPLSDDGTPIVPGDLAP
jgi:uncharacterized protein (DUF952 family)